MITNKWILGTDDYSDALKLRNEVFVEEQGTSAETESDALDSVAMHVVVYDGEKPVATGRLCHDGQTFRIGRVCVKKEVRGQGIGDLLIKLLILKAFEFNPSVVKIGAQDGAVAFYERYGFVVDGEGYIEEGLPHKPMSVTKETMMLPSQCGEIRTFEDFFEPAPASEKQKSLDKQ